MVSFPGQSVVWFPGQSVVWFPGQSVVWFPGQSVVWFPGQSVVWFPGQSVVWFPGQSVVWFPGQSVVWFPGQSVVWLHVEYVHVCVKAYTLYSWGGGGIKGALDEIIVWIWQLRTTVYFCSIHLHVHVCILLGGRELGWREVVETSCLCDSSRLQGCSFCMYTVYIHCVCTKNP